MTTKLSRRTALTALATTAATAAATAASAEAIANKLMHLEYVDRSQLRALGYEAADAIRRSTPAPAEPDPIFAAIEAHRRRAGMFTAACNVSSPLCDDDPRHPAAQAVTDEASDAMRDAALDLVCIMPTTKAGAAALLHYIASEKLTGWSLPDRIIVTDEDVAEEDEDDEHADSFLVATLRHVAESLEAMS